MLLTRIKEALSSLYEEIGETRKAPEAAEAEVIEEVETGGAAAAAVDTAPAGESQAEEPATDADAVADTIVPPGPKLTDYKTKGYHLDVELAPDKVVAAVEILNRENFFIESITGVDWIDDQQLEAVYDFNHFDELCRVVIRTRTDRSNPAIPTISHIYQGANWHERETHDFFGIKFTGHPNLEPLLLPEDADFHPLLKDFKA